MLVLSRKESQRIRLGDSIVVTIVKISGDKVRVGIEAPADVLVLRDELEVRIPPARAGSSDAADSGSVASADVRPDAVNSACTRTERLRPLNKPTKNTAAISEDCGGAIFHLVT